MLRVVIYGRVSTTVQDYERQVNELTALAEGKRWSVVRVFTEKTSGAKSNKERRGLSDMLEYIDQNDVSKVLVTELSRLGRDTLQVLQAVQALNEKGVSLYIQNYGIETLNPDGSANAMGQFMITLLAEVAKMERRLIRERMASGYRQHIQNGGIVGRKEGYRKSDEQMRTQYVEVIRLLKKGYSFVNIHKITGTSINTIKKCRQYIC